MNEGLSTLDRAPAFLGDRSLDTFGLEPSVNEDGSTTRRTLFTAPADWAGLGSLLHGGFQGLMLDEMLNQAVRSVANGDQVIPAELILRFHRPVHVAKPLGLFGYVVEDRGREISTCGEIKDVEGNLLTEAEGLFIRPGFEDSQAQVEPGAAESPADLSFAAMQQWPVWPACCKGPLERLWDLHLDWHLAPDRSALGGSLRFPAALGQVPPAGILAALFDQTLGLLGRAQGHGVMLTVRLQVTLHRLLPMETELVLAGRGSRRPGGPFNAQAWLRHEDSLVAEANVKFSVMA